MAGSLTAAARRETIGKLLTATAGEPLTGSELAQRLGVSRQVIVQDIALLRAKGRAILATPQGYLLAHYWSEGVSRTFACCHEPEDIEEELLTIIRAGGRVLDVAVEHQVYGELRGLLMLADELDVANFIKKMQRAGAQPLAALTGGVHLHRVTAEGEEDLNRVELALAKAGFLMA